MNSMFKEISHIELVTFMVVLMVAIPIIVVACLTVSKAQPKPTVKIAALIEDGYEIVREPKLDSFHDSVMMLRKNKSIYICRFDFPEYEDSIREKCYKLTHD